MGKIKQYTLKVLLNSITAYQYCCSPYLGSNCRFYPSCSEYMRQALTTHGFTGLFFGLKRLLKCHPWHVGGIDELPHIEDHKGKHT